MMLRTPRDVSVELENRGESEADIASVLEITAWCDYQYIAACHIYMLTEVGNCKEDEACVP